MNRTSYDILRELAPTDPVDPAGLEVARAAVERGRLAERVEGAFPVDGRDHLVVPGRRRAGGGGRILVAATATVLLLAAGAFGAVLLDDMTQRVGPPAGVPDPAEDPMYVPPSPTAGDGPAVQCDHLDTVLDGAPEIPSSEWPGLIEHGWTLPDVPVTAAPTLQGAPMECAGEIAAATFADPANDRAVVVYERMPAGTPAVVGRSLAEAEVGTSGSGDHSVAWEDETGRPWFARGGGVSVEELRTILGSLTYGADGSVTGPVPEGFERVETPETEPGTTLYLWRMWHDETSPYLWAWWPATAPIEAGLADGRDYTAVEFDGGTALYSPGLPGVSGNPPSLRWERDGVRYWLSDSGADLETLMARARSVRPLALDDSRLTPYLNR